MEELSQVNPFVSIIIPVKDEEGSLEILYGQLKVTLDKLKKIYEIIFIDDGSIDNSYKTLLKLKGKEARIKIIKFRANFGKSAALASGFAKAKGEIIVTIDADLQDDPAEIPKLLKELEKGYAFVSGWRKNRADTLTKKLSSSLFNKGTAFLSGIKLHDFNCGLKVFRRKVTYNLDLYGELHRFIPILIAKKKFKISEVPITNRPRKYGKSKYGLERSWRGITDLLTVIFLTDYETKPSHFFGKIGLFLLIVGLMFDGYVTYLKLTTGTTQGRIPLLIAGVLFMVLGVQLLSTGLLAELIIRIKQPEYFKEEIC